MLKSFLRKTSTALLLVAPSLSVAHDGHGNTPLHALMHMIEANGIWLGLILFVAIGSLVYQATRNKRLRDYVRKNELPSKEQGNDSR